MFEYKALPFDDWLDDIAHQQPSNQGALSSANLYELSQAWLKATATFMLGAQDDIIVHCLYSNSSKLPYIAWPLVHRNTNGSALITSLSSFYSAVTTAYYDESIAFMLEEKCFHHLIKAISERYSWHEMQLGPFEQNNPLLVDIRQNFHYQKVVKQTANFYEKALADFADYYEKRPSQLKNTLKRREKKLLKQHQYHIKIFDQQTDFAENFEHYKKIYQLSWKGEEYSFGFIEQVCLAALSTNSLRMGLLFVDEKPVAAQLWFLHHGSASIFKLAYDPAYQAFSVGSLLSMAISKHVIEIDKVTMIEFGMGSEAYKKDWLSKQRQRLSLQVFNHKTLRGNLMALKAFIINPLVNRIVSTKNARNS